MSQLSLLSAPVRAFVERSHGLLIGAEELPAVSGGRFDVEGPATGIVFASAAAGEVADVDAAVTAASQAFVDPAWRGLMPRERAKLMLAIAEVIDAHAGELGELGEIEALDNGMPLPVPIGQAYATAEAFRYYSGSCTKLMGQAYNPSGGCVAWNLAASRLSSSALTPMYRARLPVPRSGSSEIRDRIASPSRLYVHESLYQPVVDGMVAPARAVRVGAAFETGAEMGPMISAAHRDVVDGYVTQALDNGGRALTGGAPAGGAGWFYPPTVLVDVPADSAAVREEIFGPVVIVTPFRDEDHAVELANDSNFGLAASVWTRDISTGHRIAARLEKGMVGLNTHGGGDFAVPLGGYKQSGWGRENGELGLSLYLEVKSVTVALS